MGAVRDVLANAAATLRIEANAVTDNPLVLGPGEIVSGGNFHAEPVAFAADMLAIGLCEIGNLSERRMALLVDPVMSGLPAFLARDAGLNSGFMIAQVTAAALASENKQKAYPASVDTIPTSANQEDHVSMATHGAYRLLDMARNAASIVAVELMAAAEAIEHHRPLKTSATARAGAGAAAQPHRAADGRSLPRPRPCGRDGAGADRRCRHRGGPRWLRGVLGVRRGILVNRVRTGESPLQERGSARLYGQDATLGRQCS